MPTSPLTRLVARAFVAGDATVGGISARCGMALGRDWRWIPPLAQRYIAAQAGKTRPRHRDVVAFLLTDKGFRRACRKYSGEISVAQWLTEPSTMQPVPAAITWPLPTIESTAALADFLSLYPGELAWFADLKRLCCDGGVNLKLRHYNYRVVSRKSGGVRLIESPKPNLKAIQRRILTRMLDQIPPHAAAHGFIKGRSIRTFTAPHVCQPVVLRMDLADFFPSIPGARVQAFFRTAGYPEPVADLLGGLCTNATPTDKSPCALYAQPHLPQGAPTSPSLANLCSWRMDCRLAGLAKSAGAGYTRYADDLAFSGGEDFDRRVERFSTHVAAIVHEEGFRVNHHKTRIMRQATRQRLAGLVVNQHLNVPRADFDLLKATLTNCVRFGPESQNRDAHTSFISHLEGRIGFVESINPARGRRLRAVFDRIVFQSA